MRVAHRHFRGILTTWEGLFAQAAEFASTIAPQRLISISHSDDRGEGVVVVWYWEESDDSPSDAES